MSSEPPLPIYPNGYEGIVSAKEDARGLFAYTDSRLDPVKIASILGDSDCANYVFTIGNQSIVK